MIQMDEAVSDVTNVRLQLTAEPGCQVYVAGTFNNWDPKRHPLKDESETGQYAASFFLADGKYEYKFVVNGIWCLDPDCQEWMANDFGSLNSVIRIQDGTRVT